MSSYPSAWRHGRPSTAVATMAGAATTLPPRGRWLRLRAPPMPRLPRWGWLALGGLAADMLLHASPRPSTVDTRPYPNVRGFDMICGPYDHPGFPYANEIHWRCENTYSPTCLEPQSAQSFGVSEDNAATPATRTIIWGYGPNTQFLPLRRFYTFQRHARAIAGAVDPPIAVRPVDVALPAVGGALPLSPGIALAIPVAPPVRFSAAVPLPVFPNDAVRGYYPPLAAGVPAGWFDRPRPINPPYPGVNIRPIIVPDWVDVKPVYPTPEVKVPSHSALGRAIVAMFGILQAQGIAQGFFDAMWRSIPVGYRSRRARRERRIREVLANWRHVDVEAFGGHFTKFAAGYAAGAVLFGTATNAVSDAFGNAAGFGLYRAWATGERSYETNGRGYNPVRRAGPSEPLADGRDFRQNNGFTRSRRRDRIETETARRVASAYDRFYKSFRRANSDQARRRAEVVLRRDLRSARRFRRIWLGRT